MDIIYYAIINFTKMFLYVYKACISEPTSLASYYLAAYSGSLFNHHSLGPKLQSNIVSNTIL